MPLSMASQTEVKDLMRSSCKFKNKDWKTQNKSGKKVQVVQNKEKNKEQT